MRPELLIVDSVQTVSSSLSEGMAGHPSQVREVASTLIRIAKDRGLPIVLVGHVTKDGQVAGPRLLEHLVDVVCQFEGDRQTSLRFVRALKNRFGPTDEVGCFEMTGAGIAEVPDPSSLFLSRGAPVPGTCVAIALEGRRALPVEVQALTIRTTAPNPRRIVNGVDSSRVAMVLAVLERRANIKVSDLDVYVSTVGGVRFTEPAADLAIAIAVAGVDRQQRGAAGHRRDRRAEPRRRDPPGDPGDAAAQRGGAARLHSSSSTSGRRTCAARCATSRCAAARGPGDDIPEF